MMEARTQAGRDHSPQSVPLAGRNAMKQVVMTNGIHSEQRAGRAREKVSAGGAGESGFWWRAPRGLYIFI